MYMYIINNIYHAQISLHANLRSKITERTALLQNESCRREKVWERGRENGGCWPWEWLL